MKKKNLTQKQLADILDCSRSYLSELLSGKKIYPSIHFAGKIEVYTKVKIGDWVKD